MKKLTSHTTLEEFKVAYEKASGLDLPIEYLKNSKVYAFYGKGKMVGGFVIGERTDLRTINAFVAQCNQNTFKNRLVDLNQYCEVCCFWVTHEYRKHLWTNVNCWLRMAYAVKFQEKPYVIFGTNNKGLAYVYGYPLNSLLFHEDLVDGHNTYVFLARRKDFAAGVWEIIWAKILGKDRVKSLELKQTLKQKLEREIELAA